MNDLVKLHLKQSESLAKHHGGIWMTFNQPDLENFIFSQISDILEAVIGEKITLEEKKNMVEKYGGNLDEQFSFDDGFDCGEKEILVRQRHRLQESGWEKKDEN